MRALLFHCRNYGIKVGKLSNRPKDIRPEEILEKEQNCSDCIVVLVTVERGDDIKKCSFGLLKEIIKMKKEVGHKNVVILPFAHLSNNLAESEIVIKIISFIEDNLKKDFNVIRSHFGSHKDLLLDIYGHPGNARYREF